MTTAPWTASTKRLVPLAAPVRVRSRVCSLQATPRVVAASPSRASVTARRLASWGAAAVALATSAARPGARSAGAAKGFLEATATMRGMSAGVDDDRAAGHETGSLAQVGLLREPR